MVDKIITRQELVDAQKDAQALEDVINGPADTRVKPRIGPEMWTLATINSLVQQGQIKISDLSEAIQIALAAGAGSAGWTANLVADGNQTQKEINLYGGKKYDMPVGGYPVGAVVRLGNGDIVKSTVANNTKNPNVDMTGWVREKDSGTLFIYAKDIGLTKWETQQSPPYTQQQYDEAYNNGVNLANAVMAANTAGYSHVVIERGNYPFCYINPTGSTVINPISPFKITGTNNLIIDFNDSTFFVIFDSLNRSPYDKATTLQPYELRGSAIEIQGNTNLELTGFTLRGDQYFRSWVNNEQNTEQTYGVFMRDNNINTRIAKFDISGFRGDGISGNTRGTTVIANLSNAWLSGGLDANGMEIIQAGSYRTIAIDLNAVTILRNSIQIMSNGVLRSATFRNDMIDVYYYDASMLILYKETTRHCDFMYLPKNCRYVRFVAKDDERTDATVSYGTTLQLVTGSSDISHVEGTLHDNHRGGISNLCGHTTITCNIYDIGNSKQGFKFYNNSTRYGINFEDLFVSKLRVIGTEINNCPQGILVNAREFEMLGGSVKNAQYAGVAVYGTVSSVVSDVLLDNVSYSAFAADETVAAGKGRALKVSNCIVKNSTLYGNYELATNLEITVNDCTFFNSKVNIWGDGSNLVFDGNTISPLSGRYLSVFRVKNARSFKDNYIVRSSTVAAESIGWSEMMFSGYSSRGNDLLLSQSEQRLAVARTANEVRSLSGTKVSFSTTNTVFETLNVIKSGAFDTHTDVNKFEWMSFVSGVLRLGDQLNRTGTLCDSAFAFNDCIINNMQIHLARQATVATGSANLVFKNCTIDLTTLTRFLYFPYGLTTGSATVKFINCTFISDTAKSIAIVQGTATNIISTGIGCRFVGVTNTDSLTVFS